MIQMCGGLGIQMRNKSTFPTMILPDSVQGWQSTWFYCKGQPTAGQSTGLPPFSMARVEKPSSLKVVLEEKAQVKVLVERVVQLVRDGVTGMDLLEVFLSRRIQPLQAGIILCGCTRALRTPLRSTRRTSARTLEKWLMGITSNKDNPRGSRRVIPFDHSRQPEQV